MENNVQHIFIIGSKGIPGSYGGYETFVDKLTAYHENESRIKYHIACKANGKGMSKKIAEKPMEFVYHNAHCFKVSVPNVGSAQAIVYDCLSIDYCLKYIRMYNIKNPIIYVLACRMGPFFKKYVKRLHSLGGKIFINPDGHEWMRAKWSKPVQWYWKQSESLMVRYSDLVICDSKNIEKYIQETYKKYSPKTTYIAYGAEIKKSEILDDNKELKDWYERYAIYHNKYYLIVGRFVPENNFEIMIREFMHSNSKKDLVIITTKNDRFLKKLNRKLNFKSDKRVKFVGTLYNQELLKKIRENAYGYLHGHEVGGTNPSLLEALGSTKINLLFDVGFNREVAENGGLYWSKKEGDLKTLIERVDDMSVREIDMLGEMARKRIKDGYTWKYIADRYHKIILS